MYLYKPKIKEVFSMYILPYLLQISTKNLIINNLVNKFKEKITNIINKFIFSNIKNIYVKLTFSLQELVNELSTDFLKEFIEAVDLKFKNSEKRKKQFYINKSNVKRTIYTIFGDVTFYRTLYQDKYTHEYYNYIDDVLGLESYKNYDPIVRGILIQDSVRSNPSHTADFSSLNALHLKQCLEQNLSIPKQTIYLFKRQAKIGKVKYDEIKYGKTLYVMVDEKWVHKQDKTEPNKKKWIMVKCFVTFTGIERKGKRSRLLGSIHLSILLISLGKSLRKLFQIFTILKLLKILIYLAMLVPGFFMVLLNRNYIQTIK